MSVNRVENEGTAERSGDDASARAYERNNIHVDKVGDDFNLFSLILANQVAQDGANDGLHA